MYTHTHTHTHAHAHSLTQTHTHTHTHTHTPATCQQANQETSAIFVFEKKFLNVTSLLNALHQITVGQTFENFISVFLINQLAAKCKLSYDNRANFQEFLFISRINQLSTKYTIQNDHSIDFLFF